MLTPYVIDNTDGINIYYDSEYHTSDEGVCRIITMFNIIGTNVLMCDRYVKMSSTVSSDIPKMIKDCIDTSDLQILISKLLRFALFRGHRSYFNQEHLKTELMTLDAEPMIYNAYELVLNALFIYVHDKYNNDIDYLFPIGGFSVKRSCIKSLYYLLKFNDPMPMYELGNIDISNILLIQDDYGSIHPEHFIRNFIYAKSITSDNDIIKEYATRTKKEYNKDLKITDDDYTEWISFVLRNDTTNESYERIAEINNTLTHTMFYYKGNYIILTHMLLMTLHKGSHSYYNQLSHSCYYDIFRESICSNGLTFYMPMNIFYLSLPEYMSKAERDEIPKIFNDNAYIYIPSAYIYSSYPKEKIDENMIKHYTLLDISDGAPSSVAIKHIPQLEFSMSNIYLRKSILESYSTDASVDELVRKRVIGNLKFINDTLAENREAPPDILIRNINKNRSLT